MAIPFNRDDREREKFVEANSVAGLPAVAVVNPDGSDISAGGGGTTQADVHDGSGNAITSTIDGAKRGLDVSTITPTDVDVRDGNGNVITSTTSGASRALDVNLINRPVYTQPTLLGVLNNQQDQGTGNINLPLNTGTTIKIISVNLHFNLVPTAADFTIQMKDLANPVYDTTIFKVNPGNLGITDVSWYPDGEVIIPASQFLQFDFNNISTTQYGLTVIYQQIN